MIGKMRLTESLAMLIAGCILAVGPAFADEISPKDSYLKYLTLMSKAKSVEEIQPLMSKKVNAEIEKTPAKDKPMMFEFMKMTQPISVEVLKETIEGNDATLSLTGKTTPDSPDTREVTTGKVTLVKEEGVWKVEHQKWDSNVKVGGNDAPPQK